MKKEIAEKNYLESVCDKVGEVAMHYGFTIIKPPHVNALDLVVAKQFKDHDYYNDTAEKIALTRWYIEGKMEATNQPVAIHYKKPLPGSPKVASKTGRGGGKKPSEEMYGFEVMGSSRSTSEALILKCVLAILEDLGYDNLYIDINSIGDRESMVKFERELMAYYRRNSGVVPAKARQEFKKNHYSVLLESQSYWQDAPEPISSLSDIGRLHFKEVLESLEAFKATYKIRPSLFSNKYFASYTVFEIRQSLGTDAKDKVGELLAYGYRYNHLAKKIGSKREIPSVGATIIVKKNHLTTKKISIKKMQKPRFYLVQLGEMAKLKALNIVEILRKEKISVYHSITKDKITGQLSGAEYMKASHVLIMGQKEALENTIVVRNVSNREQETVSVAELCQFLKKLGKHILMLAIIFSSHM